MHTPWVERLPGGADAALIWWGHSKDIPFILTHPPQPAPPPTSFSQLGRNPRPCLCWGQLRTVEPHPFFFPWLALCRRRGCVTGLMRQCLCSGLCDQTPPATPASYKWTFRLSSVILCLPHLRGGVAYLIGFGRHFFFSFTRKAEHPFI